MEFTIISLSQEQFQKRFKPNSITTKFYKTSVGAIKLSIINNAIFEASFIDNQTNAMFSIETLPNTLLLIGTPFQINVWKALSTIPQGKTLSYKALAQQLGIPKAYRSVANALARNAIAYFIPCHRVICSNRNLGGYKWGIEKKTALLKSESL